MRRMENHGSEGYRCVAGNVMQSRIFWGLIIFLIALVAPVPACTTYVIDNSSASALADTVAGSASGDIIILGPGIYFENDITIPWDLIIQANTSLNHNATDTIIDAATNGRIFDNTGGYALTIDNLTLRKGKKIAANGGAIYMPNGGTLFVNSTFIANCSAVNGGAIYAADGTGTLNAGISSSSFLGNSASAKGGAIYFNSAGGSDGVGYSRFYQNSAPTGPAIDNDGTINSGASWNWWGTNAGPTGYAGGTGTFTAAPWLMLGTTASASTVLPGQTSTILANLTWDSGGTNKSGSGRVPDSIPVAFTVTGGSGSLVPSTGAFVAGVNATRFSSTTPGTSTINATIDGQSVSIPVLVAGASFTGTPTSGVIPLTVTFTDASAGSPTMWNWSFGDGTWFNTTSAAAKSPTHTFNNAGTYTVNLTITCSAGTDLMSRAGYITATSNVVAGSSQNSADGNDISPASPPPAVQQQPPATTTTDVNVGGNSAVTQVSVTGTGLSGIIVTGTVESGPPPGVPSAPGSPYQYVDLVPAQYTSITGATIMFEVPVSWLAEHHLSAQDIVMYHYTSTGWTALPTTVVSTSNGQVTLSATTTGFSLYAIIAVNQKNPIPGATSREDTPGAAGTPGGTVSVSTTGTVPVVQMQTTVALPDANTPHPSSPVPSFVLIGAGIIILATGGFLIRRWWIRRQNSALFREYY
jgi:PGF-pre-PGF domain-containing protein